MPPAPKRLAALFALAVAAVVPAVSSAAPAPGPIQIRTLSNRADLVSDGNALVGITLPRRVSARGLKVTVDGRDVSTAFARRSDGRVEGLIDGLALGPNEGGAPAPPPPAPPPPPRTHDPHTPP